MRSGKGKCMGKFNKSKVIGFHLLIYAIVVALVLIADELLYMNGDAVLAYSGIALGTVASWFINKNYSSRPILLTALLSPASLLLLLVISVNVAMLLGYAH